MQLRVDDLNGIMVIGDTILTKVALQSLSIGGKLIIDSSNDDSTGISKKAVSGYDDKTISMSLTVIPENSGERNYQTVSQIEELFTRTNNGKPEIYNILNDHVTARGIKQVLFSDFSSSEDNSRNSISVNLEFIEFIPARWESKTKGGASNNGAGNNAGGEVNSADQAKDNFLNDAFSDGVNSFSGIVGK